MQAQAICWLLPPRTRLQRQQSQTRQQLLLQLFFFTMITGGNGKLGMHGIGAIVMHSTCSRRMRRCHSLCLKKMQKEIKKKKMGVRWDGIRCEFQQFSRGGQSR